MTFDPQHPFAKSGKRLFLAVVVLLLLGSYFIRRYSSLHEIVAIVRSVDPWIIGAMLLINCLYLTIQGAIFKKLYQAVGVKRGLIYCSGLFLGMNVANTIAPSGGFSGIAFTTHYEGTRGMSRSRALVVNLFYYLVTYAVFSLILLAGLFFLWWQGDVTKSILIASLLFGFLFLGLSGMGAFFLTHSTALLRVVNRLNRFRKKTTSEKTKTFLEEAKEVWKQGHASRSVLWQAGFIAVGLHITAAAMLALAFLAFSVPITPQLLLVGYAVGSLLYIVSITPAGIGFAEGGMTATFVSLGLTLEHALLITILYRAIFVWFPLLLGLISMQLFSRWSQSK